MDSIDFSALEEYIYENRLMDSFLHGLDHWRQVEFNGLLLAKKTFADETVVRLFALFHDSKRCVDGYDDTHGESGAEFAAELRGKLYDLDDKRFEKLIHACSFHTTENASGDVTIDTCYDADRLDLGRVDFYPDPKKMATKAGKKLAAKLLQISTIDHRKFLRNVIRQNRSDLRLE